MWCEMIVICSCRHGHKIGCPTLVKNDYAEIGACGEVDDSLSAPNCEEMAGDVNQAQQTWLSNVNVEDTYTAGTSKSVIVFGSWRVIGNM